MGNTAQYMNLASGESLPFSVEGADGTYIASADAARAAIEGVRQNLVAPRFRIFVLYPDETVAYELPEDDLKAGGSYSENYQNGQRRSLSFTLYNDDGKYTPGINVMWAGTRLRLEMGAELTSGETVWVQKGVYVVTQAAPSLTPSGREVRITAGDKFALFENATGKIGHTYEVAPGNLAEDVIRSILLEEMGDGHPFDARPMIYSSAFKGKEIQATISKSAGDTLGGLLTEIATQLSAEIFYNAAGNLTVVPQTEVTSDGDKPLIAEFDAEDGDLSGLDFSFDYSGIVNRVIVVGGGSDGNYCRAEAKNDDPASPLCVGRIGLRTGDVVSDSNITSQVLAQERADYELRQKLILKSSTSATVAFDPILEVNNLIAISDGFYGLSHERFLVQGVSCSLDYGGQMTLSFANLSNLPFTGR